MSSSQRPVFLVLFAISLLSSCADFADISQEKENIRFLMEGIAKAHFSKDASQYYAAYNASWHDAREGQIRELSKSDMLGETQEYLDQMEFIGMESTHEPVIDISDDGKMASYMGAIALRGKFNGDPVFWVVSWQSVLKKINEEWKIISTANTQSPPAASAEVLLQMVKNKIGRPKRENILYALAECNSPHGNFSTLLLSSNGGARMEQRAEEYHIILKHGAEVSWSYDVFTGELNKNLEELSKMFVQGHELHWLSFRPEDRLKKPAFAGFETFNKHLAFKVTYKDQLDRPLYFYYSFDDYKPLGYDVASNRPGERVMVHFSDWRKLGDFQVFYKAAFIDGTTTFNYEFTDLKFADSTDYDLESRSSYLMPGE